MLQKLVEHMPSVTKETWDNLTPEEQLMLLNQREFKLDHRLDNGIDVGNEEDDENYSDDNDDDDDDDADDNEELEEQQLLVDDHDPVDFTNNVDASETSTPVTAVQHAMPTTNSNRDGDSKQASRSKSARSRSSHGRRKSSGGRRKKSNKGAPSAADVTTNVTRATVSSEAAMTPADKAVMLDSFREIYRKAFGDANTGNVNDEEVIVIGSDNDERTAKTSKNGNAAAGDGSSTAEPIKNCPVDAVKDAPAVQAVYT